MQEFNELGNLEQRGKVDGATLSDRQYDACPPFLPTRLVTNISLFLWSNEKPASLSSEVNT